MVRRKLVYNQRTNRNKGEITFKIITYKEYKECSWWNSDGTQPVSNGGTGLILNESGKGYKYLVTCCCNCGDYSFIDVADVFAEANKKEDCCTKEIE